MLRQLAWVAAIAVAISQANAKDLTPEEACDFSGVSGSIRKLFDEKSFWDEQILKYNGMLSSSRLDVRLLILENEKLRSSFSSELKSSKIYARHHGDDVGRAASEKRDEIAFEISLNNEIIKNERSQQKLYGYCLDYAKNMIERLSK